MHRAYVMTPELRHKSQYEIKEGLNDDGKLMEC